MISRTSLRRRRNSDRDNRADVSGGDAQVRRAVGSRWLRRKLVRVDDERARPSQRSRCPRRARHRVGEDTSAAPPQGQQQSSSCERSRTRDLLHQRLQKAGRDGFHRVMRGRAACVAEAAQLVAHVAMRGQERPRVFLPCGWRTMSQSRCFGRRVEELFLRNEDCCVRAKLLGLSPIMFSGCSRSPDVADTTRTPGTSSLAVIMMTPPFLVRGDSETWAIIGRTPASQGLF